MKFQHNLSPFADIIRPLSAPAFSNLSPVVFDLVPTYATPRLQTSSLLLSGGQLLEG